MRFDRRKSARYNGYALNHMLNQNNLNTIRGIVGGVMRQELKWFKSALRLIMREELRPSKDNPADCEQDFTYIKKRIDSLWMEIKSIRADLDRWVNTMSDGVGRDYSGLCNRVEMIARQIKRLLSLKMLSH